MPSTCTTYYYFGSPIFDLGNVTFTMTLLVTTNVPERDIPSMPKLYIRCILPISQMSSKGSDLGWHLTHLSRSHRSSLPWTLLVSAILPQQNITSMPKWYIWWVLPISQMSSDRWPVFEGQISQHDLSVCPSNFSKPLYMADMKPSLHSYHAQYLYLTLLFWPWHANLDLDFACYCKITWTKHHINTKMVHLLHFANISDECEGQWFWWTFDPLIKVR